MDTESSVESEFYSNKFITDYKDNIEFEVASNKSLLLDSHLAEHHILEDNKSKIEFNIMCSGLPAKPAFAIIDQRFLTSTANWERWST